jgi:hypothetical protein
MTDIKNNSKNRDKLEKQEAVKSRAQIKREMNAL